MIQNISTRDGYGKRLSELDDERIVVLTADLAESCRVKEFAERYPQRFIEVGISEQDMFGMANGLALQGKTPITNTFASFCLRAHDQIRLIAINNANVKIAGHHSGISLGADGVSQMCEQDISVFRTMPNFTVVVPCDAIEAQKSIEAITSSNGPCYLRLSREPSAMVTNEFSEFTLGKANIVRQGSDVLIVACGMMVAQALRAANILSQKGISACVMNMHTIKPLDKLSLLEHANRCKAVVSAEEHSIYGGLGSAVCEALSMERIPVKIVGIKDVFGESGRPEELFEKFGLSAERIADSCTDILRLKKQTVYELDHTTLNDYSTQSQVIIPQDNGTVVVEKIEQKTYDNDPRGRILKMSDHDKRKVDDVLYKMFGGRKN